VIPTLEVVLAGSSGVGKMAILKRLVEEMLISGWISTVGVEFDTTTIVVGGLRVELHIGTPPSRSASGLPLKRAVGVSSYVT
jgi:GTPase SAR1 family protein